MIRSPPVQRNRARFFGEVLRRLLRRRCCRRSRNCPWPLVAVIVLLVVCKSGGLSPHHPRVRPFRQAHEFLVRSLLHHESVLEDHDPVRRANGAQSVRDDEHRRALRLLATFPLLFLSPLAPKNDIRKRRLHLRLALGVERGRRLVEDEEARVSHERSCDCEPLLLSAREGDVADARVHPFRELRHKAVRLRNRERPLHILLRRSLAPVSHVLLHRSGEEVRLLRDDAEPAPEPPEIDLVHRPPAHHDPPARRLVKPLHERDERRLARAARAHERHHLSRSHVEIHPAQREPVRPRRIPERDPLKPNPPSALARQFVLLACLRSLRALLLLLKLARGWELCELEHALAGSDRLHHHRPLIRHRSSGPHDELDVQDKGGELLGGEGAVEGPEPAHKEGENACGVEEERGGEDEAAVSNRPAQIDGEHAGERGAVAPELALLRAEDAHGAHEPDRLLRHLPSPGGGVLERHPRAPRKGAVPQRRDPQDGDHRCGDRRELGGDPRKVDHAEERLHAVPEHHVEIDGEAARDGLAVGAEARDELPRLVLVKVRRLLREDGTKDALAEAADQALVHHRKGAAAQGGKDGKGDARATEHAQDSHQARTVAFRHRKNHGGDAPRDGELRQRCDDEAHAGETQHWQVDAHQSQHSTQHEAKLARLHRLTSPFSCSFPRHRPPS
mmetsp:Transcript_16551/g.54032  ORF Transcript_16551/g.54032 Transcript_16551/m.54032 type:complete len:675 (-) Transcript_16551:127-2151(-)